MPTRAIVYCTGCGQPIVGSGREEAPVFCSECASQQTHADMCVLPTIAEHIQSSITMEDYEAWQAGTCVPWLQDLADDPAVDEICLDYSGAEGTLRSAGQIEIEVTLA